MTSVFPHLLAINGGEPARKTPFPQWPVRTEEELNSLERVLRSSSWGGYPYPGEEASIFAEAFSSYLGVPHCILCSSGSVGLEYALKAIGLAPGDEVICPAYTFAASSTAIAFAHGVPVFADVRPDNYCIDATGIEDRITDRTVAIVVVHLGCNMADMDRIMEIARRHNLVVIEDCAQAHGHHWRDRPAGSIGDISVFSFEQSKLMSAGEGGAILTADPKWAGRLHSLVNCGRAVEDLDQPAGEVLGRNARMTEWQAAILQCQLGRLETLTKVRENRAQYFETRLSGCDFLSPTKRDVRNTQRAIYRYILRYNPERFHDLPRAKIVEALNAEGIPCVGGFYPPAFDSDVFSLDTSTNPASAMGYGHTRKPDCPVAIRASEYETIWFPSAMFIGGLDDIDDVICAITKIQDCGPDALS